MKQFFFAIISSLIVLGGCKISCNDEVDRSNFPPITPYWALGHIVWEDNINTQEGADSLINGYIDHNIPVDGIIIDSPWELHYNDFVWDPQKYPQPDSMLKSFMSKDVKTLLWMTGNVNKTAVDIPNQKSPDFDSAIEKGYVITVNDSAIFPWWKGDGIFIDYTNPDAVRWWNRLLDKVFKYGVYGWKVDNFRLPHGVDSLESSIGTLSERDFKKYYYNCMYDYTVNRNPEGIILARPYSHQGGYNATVSKLSVGWSGDFTGDWNGMKLQINNIYKSAEMGYGALACEIGGFSGTASNKEQLIRYSQFASMVATMDNGGANRPFANHLPWFHGEDIADIYRGLINLHRAIRPYIFSNLVESHLKGIHLINTTSDEQKSHKLGNDLFVKTITSDSNRVSFKLIMKGIWHDAWSGEKYSGGISVSKSYPLSEFPLFVREGAVIPLDLENKYEPCLNKYSSKTVILIYGSSDYEMVYHKPVGEGVDYEDISINCNKGKVTIESESEHDYVFIIKRAGTPLLSKGNCDCAFDILADAKVILRKGKNISFKIE